MALAFVYGTRAEAIKVGPVVASLRELCVEPPPVLICSGQHWDLLKGTPAETDLAGSTSLELRGGGEPEEWIQEHAPTIAAALQSAGASYVIVQGDTMSACAGALAGQQLGIPVIHIEAGLRSGDLREPWPEEALRRWITGLVQETKGWHLAPTQVAARNLRNAGIDPSRVIVTGNPVVSAIRRYSNAVPVKDPAPQVLVTMHRREWLTKGVDHIWDTIRALEEVAIEHPTTAFLWPMHPVVWHYGLSLSRMPDSAVPNVSFIPPMPYGEAVEHLAMSLGVATDSGGLQEEAGTLGVPCAVLRNLSDRPESITYGTARLYQPGPEGMKRGLEAILRREIPRSPHNLYGTPDSDRIIAEFLAKMP